MPSSSLGFPDTYQVNYDDSLINVQNYNLIRDVLTVITIIGFHGAGSLKTSHPWPVSLLQAPRVDCTLQRNGFSVPCAGAGSDTRQLSSYFVCDVSACRDAPMFLAFGGQETENET